MKKINGLNVFPIAAIGASAGGLKAFEELLSVLPPEPGLAFVLVPHLAPQYESHLAEILARNTRLPVAEAKRGDKVLPNRVYIIPPNSAMLIKAGVLHLSSLGHQSASHNPIDSFFRSLATDQKKNSIGVLLSGEGSDGTEGLRAIKNNGGTTFAQDAKTAAHLSMPHSAAVSGCADFILAPAEIGKRLGSMRGTAGFQATGKNKLKPAEDSLNSILELLRTAKGVEFELYKRSTLRRRIQRRMTLLRIHEPEKYFRMLVSDSVELDQLYSDILISVTSFFREPESFKALKSTIYPRILKKRAINAPIRVWVPGCSTGEEAYSHAINLAEFLGPRAAQIHFQIFATDVNPAVIEKARAGLYPKKIRTYVSPERLRRFFIETPDGYRIVPLIRERCIFAAKNLVKDPPFTNLDLISCRNLLIYLGPALQEKAMQIFQYALKPRGILMLGHSETTAEFFGGFSPVKAEKKVFSERTSESSARLDLFKSGRFMEAEPAFKVPGYLAQAHNKETPDDSYLCGGLDSILPARYFPNGVIVNSELEILRFLGNTSAYLRPAPGKPSMNLRRMAPSWLLLELRTAIYLAKKSVCAVCKDITEPNAGQTSGRIRIEVRPFNAGNTFLVLFEQIASAETFLPVAGAVRVAKDSRRVIELKEDLAVSAEHLKAIIEEQETTNARLKSANEELLSGNEELQSINEEFETSKEELQSANEELITSTEELGDANQILNGANSDFSNILANIDIPIILLGPDLTIRRFTPPAAEVLHLSSDKIGRPVEDIQLPLRLPNLKQLLLSVIKTGHVHRLEVADKQGRWYYLIMRPYRTDKNKTEKSRIEGAVMALIDIHDRKSWEKTVLRLATLVSDSNDAIIIRDLKNRIVAWNNGAQKMYGYIAKEALGSKLTQLIPEKERGKMRELVRLAAQEKQFAQTETRRRAKDGRILDVLLTVTMLHDKAHRSVEFATTERDITEQKQAERELRKLHASVISSQETERKHLARELHDGVGQILSGIKFSLESLPVEVALSGKYADTIVKVGGFLSHAISEVRRVSQNLMPSEIVDLGLVAALRALFREFKERSGVVVTLKILCLPPNIAPDLELALFRIAQEALNNIEKHAKATKVAVVISKEGKKIVLSARDNGAGFTTGTKLNIGVGGIGLVSMRERAELVGGSMSINSTPGAGTTLTVSVPLSGLIAEDV